MDDLEQRLQRARLVEPSTELDRRIESAFHSARRTSAVAAMPARPWWFGAVAAGLSLAAGLLVSVRRDPPAPPPVPIVWQIEAAGRLRDLLVEPSRATEALPRFTAAGPTP